MSKCEHRVEVVLGRAENLVVSFESRLGTRLLGGTTLQNRPGRYTAFVLLLRKLGRPNTYGIELTRRHIGPLEVTT